MLTPGYKSFHGNWEAKHGCKILQGLFENTTVENLSKKKKSAVEKEKMLNHAKTFWFGKPLQNISSEDWACPVKIYILMWNFLIKNNPKF